MNPLVLAGPAVEPVTLADAKLYLRVDHDTEDELIAALIAAARLTLESATRLALVTQTWRLRVPASPDRGLVELPRGPVQAILAVRRGADAVELAPSAWMLDGGRDPPRLRIDATPSDAGARPAFEIDLRVGFGDAPACIPPPLRLALRMLVARWYANRGDTIPAGAADLRGEIAGLIAPFCAPRLA